MIAVLPIEVSARLSAAAGTAPGYNRTVVLMPFDVPLIALTALALPSLIARLRRSGRGAATLLALVGFGLVALAFNPSWRGMSVVVRLVGAVVVAVEVASLGRRDFRRRVAVPLLAAAALQAVVAYAQVVTAGPVGLDTIGERSRLYLFGDSVAGQGTMIHPYVLAGFCLLAALVGMLSLPAAATLRRRWTVLIAAAASPLAITYSRTAALGVAAAGTFLAVAARRDATWRVPVVTTGLAILLPALLWNGGWVERAGATTEGSLDEVTSGRVTLTRQSIDLITDHPLVGVGPGLYTVVLERDHAPTRVDAVHTVPLLIAAEDGIPAGLAFVLAVGAVTAGAVTAGLPAVALAAAMMPFLLLDKWLYLHPNGLIMLAVWLGALDWFRRTRSRDDAATATAS